MSTVPDGSYTIGLPFGGGFITDTGEGRYLNLLPHGALGPDADQIKVAYNSNRGAYSFQFSKSGKYLTYLGELFMNSKLVTGDKPAWFKITKHHYELDKFTISSAEQKEFHVGPALERIFPPWVAMISSPDRQAWAFEKA